MVILFFLGTHLGRTRGWISTVHGSYDVLSPKDVLLGLQQYRNSFGGNILQKLPKRGVNRQFQAKRGEYKNRDILQSINMINMQL